MKKRWNDDKVYRFSSFLVPETMQKVLIAGELFIDAVGDFACL